MQDLAESRNDRGDDHERDDAKRRGLADLQQLEAELVGVHRERGWTWPIRSLTTLMRTSAATRSEASVWPRSWKRMRGSSLRPTIRSNNWLTDSGLRNRPPVMTSRVVVEK